MNWYKIAQQQEFEEIREQIPTEEDQVYAFYDASKEAIYDVLNELKESKPGEKQPWILIPAARVNKIWNDYAIYGVVRDARGMDEIADRMIKNVHRIYANTYLMGHTPGDPSEEFEEYGIDEELKEHYYWEYGVDEESGQARISDYAMDPLQKDAIELMKAKTPEEKLLIVDRMFNRIHRRSDLSAMFIEGGSDSLDILFSDTTEAFNLKEYKTAQVERNELV